MMLLCAIPVLAWAQFNITGTVREKSSGQALSGASVGIVGQYLGTVSNPSGEFTLRNINKVRTR